MTKQYSIKLTALITFWTCLLWQTTSVAQEGDKNIKSQKSAAGEARLRNPDVVPAPSKERIEKNVRDLMQKHGYPSISIGIIFGDDLIYSESFGVVDRETKLPATPDTLYQIGSVTKVFTATLLVEMRDKGVLRLDDPISKYLPRNVSLPTDPRGAPVITLRHLATHTSGLPPDVVNPGREKDGDPWTGYPLKNFYDGLPKTKLAFPTGSQWGYSNLGFGLLGQVLERSTGKPYERLLKQNIFAPLKMNDSTITLEARHLRLLARPYRDDNPMVKTQPWEMGVMSPAGGIASSVTDLSRFVSLQFRAGEVNQAPVSGSSLLEMQTAQRLINDWRAANGLGWRIDRSERIGNVVSHGGDVDGYASYVAFSPVHKIGVVILTNCGIGQPIGAFGGWLMSEAVQSIRPSLSKPATPEEADAYSARTDARNAVWAYETIIARDSQNGFAFSRLGVNLLRLQKYDEALKAFQKALELKFRPPNTAYNLACAYALKGDRKSALDWLERALKLGFQPRSALLTDSDLNNIREDARFKQLLQLYP